MLQNFVDGDLPASLAAGVAMHAGMCPMCQQKIIQLTEQVAEANFEESSDLDLFTNDADMKTAELDFDDIIGEITASDDVEPMKAASIERSVSFKGTQYVLPQCAT